MPRHHQMIVDVAHNGQQLQIVSSGMYIYKCLTNGEIKLSSATSAEAMRWLAGFIEDNSLDEPDVDAMLERVKNNG